MTARIELDDTNTITPRRMVFKMDNLKEKYFFDENPISSTYMYAMSAMFPDGERFFISSVKHYQREISNPVLLEQIRGFIGQEAHHGRVHSDFNASVQALGFPMDRLVQRNRKRLAFLKKTKPSNQLAITAALEHVTASMAQYLLEHPVLLQGKDSNDKSKSPMAEMMIWHAVEEIEHKAVAFDVYREVINDERQRILVAKVVFRAFFFQVARSQLTLLWSDRKLPSLSHIREAFNLAWGKDGIMRFTRRELKKYLRHGFHPNDIDQSKLIQNWREKYPEVASFEVR